MVRRQQAPRIEPNHFAYGTRERLDCSVSRAVCADGYFAVAGGLCEACESGVTASIILPVVVGAILLTAVAAVCVRRCGKRLADAAMAEGSGDDAKESMLEAVVEGLERTAADNAKWCTTRAAASVAASALRVLTGMKFRILISLFQMLTGLAPVYTITYPRIYKDVLNVPEEMSNRVPAYALPLSRCLSDSGDRFCESRLPVRSA